MNRFRRQLRFRRSSRPAIHPSRAPHPTRRAWGTSSHALLAVSGLILYFAMLWFGIEVIGDNATRSSLMAGVIVLIAAVGYAASRQPAPRDK